MQWAVPDQVPDQVLWAVLDQVPDQVLWAVPDIFAKFSPTNLQKSFSFVFSVFILAPHVVDTILFVLCLSCACVCGFPSGPTLKPPGLIKL